MQIVKAFLTQNPCYVANVKRADGRYRRFQDNGPQNLMLHSVGCAQPSAKVFCDKWNREDYDRACVHAFIDANTGDIWQTLPWTYRGWHCGGSANDTDIGVEMCESAHIRYTSGAKIEILNRTKAVEDCVRTYASAVELFAFLCTKYNLDPLTNIRSHKEGGVLGVATRHVDPEHYWKALGMPYSMDGFRKDVKHKMEENSMTANELESRLAEFKTELIKEFKMIVDSAITERLGPPVKEITDNSIKSFAEPIQKLLDCDVLNGGTSRKKNPNDINFGCVDDVRVMAVMSRYVDMQFEALKNLIAIRSE